MIVFDKKWLLLADLSYLSTILEIKLIPSYLTYIKVWFIKLII